MKSLSVIILSGIFLGRAIVDRGKSGGSLDFMADTTL